MKDNSLPDSPETSLTASLAFVRRLVAQGGPTASDYAALDRLMQLMPALAPEEVAQLRATFGEALHNTETMQAFAYRKPRGYAGDFEIIDRIYCERVTAVPALAAWDRYFHAQPATRAVRNRKRYFHALLDRHRARGRPLRVLNLASGPGRCMAEWLRANPGADAAFTCVELDAFAIEHARALVQADAARVTFHHQNIVHFVPEQRFDVIWAAGICDYFSEALVIRLLRRLRRALAPGGELVVGNFGEYNPTRPYMEVLGEWRLHHRSPELLRELAQAAGVESADVSVGAEPEGVNLFLHIAGPSH